MNTDLYSSRTLIVILLIPVLDVLIYVMAVHIEIIGHINP